MSQVIKLIQSFYAKHRMLIISISVFLVLTLPGYIQDTIPYPILKKIDSPSRYLIFYLSMVLLILVGIFEFHYRSNQSPRLIIVHSSMEQIDKNEIINLYSSNKIETFDIDLTNFYQNDTLDWLNAINNKQIKMVDQLNEQITKSEDYFYAGIVHIPLAIHLGFSLSDNIRVRYLNRQRDTDLKINPWEWPQNDTEYNWTVEKKSLRGLSKLSGGMSLLVEYSSIITDKDLVGLDLPEEFYRISIKNPGMYDLNSENKIRKFGRNFREIIDELLKIDVIHLFVAAPVPIAFELGRNISKTMHPKVFVYNYQRSKNPCYEHVLTLNDK